MKDKLYKMLMSLFGKTTGFSKEEITKIEGECQKMFGLNFLDSLNKAKTEAEDQHQQMLQALFGDMQGNDGSGADGAGGDGAGTDGSGTQGTAQGTQGQQIDPVQAINAMKQTMEQQAQQITALNSQILELGKQGEEVKPLQTRVPKMNAENYKTHLFGIADGLFDLKSPWNRVAKEGRSLQEIGSLYGFSENWKDYENDFLKAASDYGTKLGNRIMALHQEGRLATLKMQDIDFSGYKDTNVSEYITRRMDTLIAYVRQLNSLQGIFPVQYGIQHKSLVNSAFFTSGSQSYQTGRIFKGGVSVEPIEAQMYKLMFKTSFENMKDLEDAYIGYLNKEGNDPMKWGWIEWVNLQSLMILMNEWNQRRILGRRVEPTKGSAGHFLHGSDGVLWQLYKWAFEEYRIQPVESVGNYTQSTILDTVRAFVAFAHSKLPSLNGARVLFNEKHKPWYTAAYREKFALNQDFTGSVLKVVDYEDVTMVPVPNMGNSCVLILELPGANIMLAELKAGEMSQFTYQRDLEMLMSASYWSEGIIADRVGKKHADAAKLAAEDYKNQYIFVSNPIITVAADATTLDATKGYLFKSSANTAAKALTDVTGLNAGIVVRFICGSTTNKTTISKSGKFANLTADFTPTAVGDYIEFYLYFNEDDATDAKNNTFVEVARKVTA